MITIGILLPGSTLYPSIGMDFIQGLRSCLSFHQYDPVDIQPAVIGFGVKENDIYAAVEKCLLVSNADVVIAYLSDYHAEKLAPLFAAAGKLLIIINAGSAYPVNTAAIPNTVFHAFDDCVCCFLTGKYAARQEGGHGAIMATSFFDGGYSHCHAMNASFNKSGGETKMQFVSRYKKEEFSTETLEAFIQSNPDVKKILAVFSADTARFLFEKMMDTQKEYGLQWYASPMMFDCTPGDFAEAKPSAPDMCGYTNWVPELNIEANQVFLKYYKDSNGKNANLFSMQGWESALFLMAYLETRKNAAGTTEAIEQLTGKEIDSPRGTVRLNRQKYMQGPVHFVQSTGNLQLTVGETITDLSAAWEEMCGQVPKEVIASWRNTYLCI